MAELDGMNALVTGASRGIGAAVAERLAAAGANVAVTARTAEPGDGLPGSLSETAATCRRYGRRVAAIQCNLTDGDDRAGLVQAAADALGGPIDVLVNNAAAGIHRPAAELSLRHRRIMFEVNFHAPIDLMQQAIPAMKTRGRGWIVNMSSGSSELWSGPPFPSSIMGTTNAAYGATKAALNRYGNVLAVELYGTGVRLNMLQPARAVATEGALAHIGDRVSSDELIPVEVIAEATLALSRCEPDLTGRVLVDEALVTELGLTVRTLDGLSPLRPTA